MSEISEHSISGTPLLEWVAGHKNRNYAWFTVERQLEWAKKIAKHKDDSARNLLLVLLQEVVDAEEKLVEMHAEMDTVHRALTKIDATLNSKP